MAQLTYFIQPLEKIKPAQKRQAIYEQAQQLREKLQMQIKNLRFNFRNGSLSRKQYE